MWVFCVLVDSSFFLTLCDENLSLIIQGSDPSESSQDKCLADLCGALHFDFVINSPSQKSKCNPAAPAGNCHLCEDLANTCFPSGNGPSAARLHEFFVRQLCDAHTFSKGRKPFSRGGRKHAGVFYLAMPILIMMLLPIFYALVYLYQREMRKGTQQLKFVSKPQRKTKPLDVNWLRFCTTSDIGHSTIRD